ncbi:hypothetical protein JMUB6875_48840 [Nocardia sp. JMUB6875]|uniref:SCO4402 family protein n=1 Tax=Nocardia sp. JMUB6875 TaxID=3158170 RepID=UPI0032E6B661
MVVEFPDAREGVIECLRDLADREFQQRVWVERKGDPNLIESLDQTIGDLFDTFLDHDGLDRFVGAILMDNDEAHAIKELAQVLLPLYRSLPSGPHVTDEKLAAAAISDPGWDRVVDYARRALTLMSR